MNEKDKKPAELTNTELTDTEISGVSGGGIFQNAQPNPTLGPNTYGLSNAMDDSDEK